MAFSMAGAFSKKKRSEVMSRKNQTLLLSRISRMVGGRWRIPLSVAPCACKACPMKLFIMPLFAGCAMLAGLTQCASDGTPEKSSKPSTAAESKSDSHVVSLPSDLSKQESACMEQVIQMLKDTGFRPTHDAGGVYQLGFHVSVSGGADAAAAPDSGPVSATDAAGHKKLSFALPGGPMRSVVNITLRKGPSTVATAEGTFEAVKTEVSAEENLQHALDRCLRRFTARIKALNETGVDMQMNRKVW